MIVRFPGSYREGSNLLSFDLIVGTHMRKEGKSRRRQAAQKKAHR